MKKLSLILLMMFSISLLPSMVFADEPSISIGDRWANADNQRKADDGQTIYRCATDDKGKKPDISQETIDRWIQENRIVAGGVIPVYFHVIYSGSEGNVAESALDAQIQVLNRNYSGRYYDGTVVSGAANTGYTFTKAGTDRTNNRKWFRMTPGTAAESQAKNALSITPGSALNIFICKPGQNLLGWAVFPWTSAAGTKQDGVVIHYGSLPGGNLPPYNLGGTASHEVGHYLGLYHTFQGGCDTGSCSTTGDNVCDTPAEATATSGCPAGKNTCAATGNDPIHNYMDYSSDACYDNFTAGQDTRMNTMVTAYRAWIGATRVANDGAGGPGILDEPDPINPRQLAEFGEGKAHSGETVYRCATDAKGKKPDLSQETIDRWVRENRIVAGGNIPVYVHVITKKQGRTVTGDVTDQQIADQITVLNRNYSGRDYDGNVVSGAANTGYTFTLAGIDRTSNSKWFSMTPGTAAESQAKAALSINPGGALNIFLCGPGQNLLGWAVFPWTSAAGTNQDGVVIHYASIPGGSLAPYNLGGTASHEVGHYLGLYHTFQGGCDTGSCSTTGDNVCDTPAEATATSGCPAGKNTCAAAGNDPINNYMDYSTDVCYTNFTTGQDTRMNTMVTAYRAWIGATRVANGAGGLQFPTIRTDGPRFAVKPNPFNPRTKVEFGLVKDGKVSIRVYDIQGRLAATLVDRRMAAGTHSIDFDASRMASGVYQMVLRIEGEKDQVKRITLLK